MFRLVLLVLIVPLYLAGSIFAQSPERPRWSWDEHRAQWNLLWMGSQIGAWDPAGRVYRDRLGDGWSEPRLPPIPTPGSDGDTTPIGGVVNEKAGRGERLSIGGITIDPNVFYGPQLPDDRTKPYLLVTGDQGFLDRAKPLFAPGGRYESLKSQVAVGFFPVGGWQCQGVGYREPGVYLLGPRDAITGVAQALDFQAAPDLDGLDHMVAAHGLRQPAAPFDAQKIKKPLQAKIQGIGTAIAVGAGALIFLVAAAMLPRMWKRP